MIMPSDKDYKETKQIMLGEKNMNSDFKLLANWIDSNFNVKTVNIKYDTIDQGTRPRLGVFFETVREANSFQENGQFSTFDSKKQELIADKFTHTLKEQGLIKKKKVFDFFKSSHSSKYKTDNIWIYTSAFEPIARIEANEKIPQDKVEELKREFNNDELWEISRAFSGMTFFFYTDEQVKKYENSETVKKWTDKYFELLTQYDEFGYFKKEFFSIYLDSKENFDNNYESNWYYYYK